MKIGSLRGLKDIKENISFNLETPISEIAAVIKEKSIGAVPIIDDQNKLIGIVSERDIVTKMVVEARDADLTTAQEIMTKEIIIQEIIILEIMIIEIMIIEIMIIEIMITSINIHTKIIQNRKIAKMHLVSVK